jgi:SAM-dependent methyltransferase
VHFRLLRIFLFRILGRHWNDSVRYYGRRRTAHQLLAGLRRALRESLSDRRRARYGDLDFDFDYSVDTTRSSVKPVRQFIAMLTGSPYFASEPWLFEEMMRALPIDFQEFTFIDLGSGKGRALLMAAEHPFQQIIGVEFMPDLHSIALRNIATYRQIKSWEMDARDFDFPLVPLVLYLFNPFPEPVFAAVLTNLEGSLRESPRPVYVAYRSPEFEHLLAA